MVFYFSGTGNSRYVAENIATATGDEIVSLNEKFKDGDCKESIASDRIVFVTPTYSWRVPRIVFDWISRAEFSLPAKVWFVMTCGGEIGNAEKYNAELCQHKNFEYMGTVSVLMPDNYIVMFTPPGKDETNRIYKEAELNVKNYAAMIKNGTAFPKARSSFIDRFLSGPVNSAFYKFYVKADKFTADDNCIGCGKCAEMCPLGNIDIKNGKPVWGQKCTQCMACISYCPTESIEYGKTTKDKKRYRFEYNSELGV